ncbi:MAG: hypothetical protein NZ901_05485 [Geminocystis sp.]|nr:hypothetical protein [Geminocystis sp.]HIK38664.1 hypothetical protein [Geminocystis sp. M7585_C2015_104]MCS7147628.1 hypothetical protein [Geminocystis sp.]MCX8078031.1 hypothetical protein [Geminocystis sp.]MDW8115321.1 hypothetical protein [Geminocystis sp.]
MNDRQDNWQKFRLSLYLMPIFGPVFSFLNLQSHPTIGIREKKIARLSLFWGLFWLVSYTLLSLGGATAENDVWAFRILYLNGVITTTYFLVCFLLIYLLWKRNN